jgi:hypothetical protein
VNRRAQPGGEERRQARRADHKASGWDFDQQEISDYLYGERWPKPEFLRAFAVAFLLTVGSAGPCLGLHVRQDPGPAHSGASAARRGRSRRTALRSGTVPRGENLTRLSIALGGTREA